MKHPLKRTDTPSEGIRYYFSLWFRLAAVIATALLLVSSVRVNEGGLELSNPWLFYIGAAFAAFTCAMIVLPYLTISEDSMRIYLFFKTRHVKLDAIARFVMEEGGSISVHTGTGVKYTIRPLYINSSERKSLVEMLRKIAPFEGLPEHKTGGKE